MEGSGVTNYSTDMPSYAYSTATTEFDDALIKRGIVSHTQAMVGKGASPHEAHRLTELKEEEQRKAHLSNTTQPEQDDSDDSFEDDDDDFMNRYRQERLTQLQHTSKERQEGRLFGQAIVIDRTEWTREVNQASQLVWVVVCLTSSDTERTGKMQEAVQILAQAQETTKFVLIPAQQAIADWPHSNLPSLFVYRHGSMQKQLVSLPHDISSEELYGLLRPILESNPLTDPDAITDT